MSQQKQKTSPTATYDTFPCPSCSEEIRVGSNFCGFCAVPLRVQCSACGQWTRFDHKTCPSCGENPHTGPSFAERQRLLKLQKENALLQEKQAQSAQFLEDLFDELSKMRRNALIRPLTVIGLSAALAAGLANVFTGLTTSFTGIVILIIAICLFRYRIPGLLIDLFGSYSRLVRWAVPMRVGHLRQEIEEEQVSLQVLATAISTKEKAIADLECQMRGDLEEDKPEAEKEEEEALEEEEEEIEAEEEALEEEEEEIEAEEEALEEEEEEEAV